LVEFSLYTIQEFFVAEFLLLIVYHGELIGLEFVFFQFDSFSDEIGELYEFSVFGIVFDSFFADVSELIDGFVIDL